MYRHIKQISDSYLVLGGEESSDRQLTVCAKPPAQQLLSFLAPLCRAMLGAEAGDELDFGGREAALEVLEVG